MGGLTSFMRVCPSLEFDCKGFHNFLFSGARNQRGLVTGFQFLPKPGTLNWAYRLNSDSGRALAICRVPF